MSRLPFVLAVFCFLLSSCATTRTTIKQEESVSIVLNDGTRIKAEVLDITDTKIVFNASHWKQAYEYGEVLPREKVQGVKLRDGTVLSLAEYEAFRKDSSLASQEARETGKKRGKASAKTDISLEEQLEQLKNKPISEMSENEFKFFMAMLEQEQMAAQARREKMAARRAAVEKSRQAKTVTGPVPVVPPRAAAQAAPAKAEPGELHEIAASLLDAGVAVQYLAYLDEQAKASDNVGPAAGHIGALIREDPAWREHKEELAFLHRTAEKAIGRVYLYNPQDLQDKLGLDFNPDADMDFHDLLHQLHRAMGEDITMRDYRKLVDVFGESGGLAVRDALQSYSEILRVVAAK